MLIITDKPGQLCNRLFAFTPFIEYALENNCKIVILHFYDYFKYFEDLKVFKNVHFIQEENSLRYYKFLIRILNKVPKKKLKSLGIYHNTNTCVSKINLNNKVVFIKGWSHKKPNFQAKTPKISQLFQPKKSSVYKVDEIFLKQRALYDIVIGVHIRRGDYKEFYDGAYFYSDLTYNNFICQIKDEFSQQTKLAFLLCSNEKINTESYSNSSTFQIRDANIIEDLYGLSKCDYIIGPPSTYSMWASYYGQKPLLIIKNPSINLKIKDFSIIIAQNRFENGNIFSH